MKGKLKSEFTGRQEMREELFELYYYSDIWLEPVKPHEHPCYELYFFLEGNVRMHVGDLTYSMQPGDFLAIPPHTVHYPLFGGWEKSYRRVVLWVEKSYGDSLAEQWTCYGRLWQMARDREYRFSCRDIEASRIQNRLFELLQEMKDRRYGWDVDQRLQLERLLLYMNRIIHERDFPEEERREQSVYEKICSYVEEHLEEDLTLQKIAGEFYLSKYHIAHLFKENSGMSLHQYILKKRLEICRRTLREEMSISRVYACCGFRDYSSFYRAFRKEYGISPKEYKRQIKGEQYDRNEKRPADHRDSGLQ